jgi:hypothetical protein
MAGHSRSKNGVLKDAYVPAIHVFLASVKKDVDARDIRAFTPVFRRAMAGHDVEISAR